MGAFGGSRGMAPKPPEKGVFPLDHFGECSKEMSQYLSCLKENGDKYSRCQVFAQGYLKCRMEKQLMEKQDLNSLGVVVQIPDTEPENTEKAKERVKKGFIGGSRH